MGRRGFFRCTSAKLGNAHVLRCTFIGKPAVAVAGMKNIKLVFDVEFES